jgi:hypothetical protein
MVLVAGDRVELDHSAGQFKGLRQALRGRRQRQAQVLRA